MNNAIHKGTNFSYIGVIERTNTYLQWSTLANKMLKTAWSGCEPRMEIKWPEDIRRSQKERSTTRWTAPPPGWIKLNTDGAFSAEAGQAGGGGVIRDARGYILEGFASCFLARSSLEAELEAALTGLKLAQKWGNNIWMEVDAQMLISLLAENGKGAAELRHKIAATRILMAKNNCKVAHIPREGNMLADWLAKQARQGTWLGTFNAETAPPTVKEIAKHEQIDFPLIRGRE